MQTVIKSYETSLSLDPGSRTVLATISTDGIDRDGEVVSPKGMKATNFRRNPVVLLNHGKTSLPIGKALWIKPEVDSDGRGKIKAKYFIHDKTEEARAVFGMLQDGILNSHSISFMSNHSTKPTTAEINKRADLKDAKLIHRDWELLEFSVVTIPANPDAVTLAVSKGYSEKAVAMLRPAIEEAIEGTKIVVEEKAYRADVKAVCEAARRIKISVDLEKSITAALNRM